MRSVQQEQFLCHLSVHEAIIARAEQRVEQRIVGIIKSIDTREVVYAKDGEFSVGRTAAQFRHDLLAAIKERPDHA